MSFTDVNLKNGEPSYEMKLCKLNEEKVMSIKNITDFKFNGKFINIDEISFKVPLYREDNKGNSVENERFSAIKGDMLILLNGRRFFYIHYAKETASKDGKIYKEVQAYSREYELSQKRVVGYSGDSRFLYKTVEDPETNKAVPDVDENGMMFGILNYIESISSWRVGSIEPTLLDKARTLNFSKTNALKALQDVQKTFDCAFFYDTVEREIKVLDVSKVGTDRGLWISDKNFLQSLSKEIKSDEIKTRLYLEGENGRSIQSLQITGQPYVENFDFYKNEDYMSRELIDALDNYEEFLQSYEKRFENLLKELDGKEESGSEPAVEGLNSKRDKAEIKLRSDKSDLKVIQSKLDVLISSQKPEWAIGDAGEVGGDTIESLKAEERAQEQVVEATTSELKGIKEQIEAVESEIRSIQEKTDIKTVFDNDDLIRELDSFIKEDTFSDNDYTEHNVDLLYEEGLKVLRKISSPKIQFSTDVVDFLSLVECKHTWNKFILGDKVRLRHKELNFDYIVNLVSYTHTPQTNKLVLKFSSTNSIEDSSVYMSELLGELTSSSNTVDFNKYKWDKGEDADSAIKDFVSHNLDLSKQALVSAEGQKRIFDDRGYWGYKVDPDTEVISPYQLRMTNDVIAMTKNDWNDVDIAISPEFGINATMISGMIGNFAKMNADNIVTGTISSRDALESVKIDLDSGDFNFKDVLTWSNSDKRLKVMGDIYSSTIKIGGTEEFPAFSVDTEGKLTANNGYFKGDIRSSSIKIGGTEAKPVFHVDTSGNLFARSGHFEGDIRSSSIKLGGTEEDPVFSVDSRGNMNARSGSFSGSITGATGTFSGSVSANKILIGGSNGSISFSGISGVPDFKTGSQVTSITENTIKTGDLTATNLKVAAANITGTLTANQIASNISQVDYVLTVGTSAHSMGTIKFGSDNNSKISTSDSGQLDIFSSRSILLKDWSNNGAYVGFRTPAHKIVTFGDLSTATEIVARFK